MQTRWLVYWLMLFTPVLFAHVQQSASEEASQRAFTILKDAEAHIDVLPEKSMALLNASPDMVAYLNPSDATRWHFAVFDAGLKLADNDAMERGLKGILAHQDTDVFREKLPKVANSLGVWFRRNGHYPEARLSYMCSVGHATKPLEVWRAMTNLAVVARNMKHLDAAITLNQTVLDNADKRSLHTLAGSAQNNLGMIYLNQKRYPLAAEHFHIAMDSNQRNSRRASEILNGINLLFTFYNQGQFDLFNRLYPRIDRLLHHYPESARHAYLRLVYQLMQAKSGRLLSDEVRSKMLEDYRSVNDTGIQTLMHPDLKALDLPVFMPDKQITRPYAGKLMEQMTMCSWAELKQKSYNQIIEDVISGNNS